MTNHGLTRNPDNEPVCICGYRPEILDEPAPVGKQWKAKSCIVAHATALNPQPEPVRSPLAPFNPGPDAKYPRAGLRRREDGQWIVTLWDADGVSHAWEREDNALHGNRMEAFSFAQWFIKCHRDSGVRLNGMAAA
jgi:hypothetical protein